MVPYTLNRQGMLSLLVLRGFLGASKFMAAYSRSRTLKPEFLPISFPGAPCDK